MYAFLDGTVEEIDTDRLAINCGGVGYEVLSNTASIQSCKVGGRAKLYTRLSVREDALTLFGFCTREEKAMFDRLITVSGIGPKVALSILSAMSASETAIAIVTGDEKALGRVPGIGKKTAQRLILELKGAVANEQMLSAPATVAAGGESDAVEEAIAILVAMGFSPMDSAAAVALVKAEGGAPEEMAIAALRRLDRG